MGFHYHGKPVTAQEASDILRDRHIDWRRVILARKRDHDHRYGTFLRRLWSMIRWRG